MTAIKTIKNIVRDAGGPVAILVEKSPIVATLYTCSWTNETVLTC